MEVVAVEVEEGVAAFHLLLLLEAVVGAKVFFSSVLLLLCPCWRHMLAWVKGPGGVLGVMCVCVLECGLCGPRSARLIRILFLTFTFILFLARTFLITFLVILSKPGGTPFLSH